MSRADTQTRFDYAYTAGAEHYWSGGRIHRLIPQQERERATIEGLAYLYGYIDAKRGNVRPFNPEPKAEVQALIDTAEAMGKTTGDLASELREQARTMKAVPEPVENDFMLAAHAESYRKLQEGRV
jgi:hypothetical protein